MDKERRIVHVYGKRKRLEEMGEREREIERSVTIFDGGIKSDNVNEVS
jgi:hypothetical protein